MDSRISIITLGVRDFARSYRFYTGLGFETSSTEEGPIAFFQTRGTRLALYPLEALAEDLGEEVPLSPPGHFQGFTLAHNTRKQEEVDAILKRAVELGGTLVKAAKMVFWGGYSGYFKDPDGYYWEVAYADSWKFNPDGSLVLGESESQ